MFKNRYVLILAGLTMLLVTLAVSRPFSKPPNTIDPRIPGTGAVYQPYIIDSGTRSYIAWGEALQAAGKLSDSSTCANAAQANVLGGIDNNLDSATRSYIARGLALQAKADIRALCH